ncbi:hypothetical protein [Enterococcus mundtii]|uniref:hypothetical protein n=1 Tax=Enterococcus mundtii TaxID=53346 RepID=UPI000824A918|nr:hypothetical protein [Enterococcus mundtii]
MNRYAKLVGTMATVGTLLSVGASSVSATTYSGQTEGRIPAIGRLGAEIIPPINPDELINVTVPTSTVFFTTAESDHTEIESPTYTIRNNSAWGLRINMARLDNPENISNISRLMLERHSSTGTTGTPIIIDGEPTGHSMSARIMDLPLTDPNGEFSFTGTAIPNSSNVIIPTFDMVLRFSLLPSGN